MAGLPKPYRRNWRPFLPRGIAGHPTGGSQYIRHARYAQNPQDALRAFKLLQQDLIRLFDSVEPADSNVGTFSYRIHELLLRCCIEVEANFRAILLENGYLRPGRWNMGDYKKLEASHQLSGFQVRLPVWRGAKHTRAPFAPWVTAAPLPWYEAYHATKHDRHVAFDQAQLEHAVDAFCCLAVLLAAQFADDEFAATSTVTTGSSDGMESGIGGYLRIRYPTWSNAEQYAFVWSDLANDPDPFVDYPYP